MKYVLMVAAASLGFAVAPALAADPIIYEEPPVYVDPFSWTGFYVGINGGYGGGDFEHPISVWAFDGEETFDIANGSLDITSSGFLGGVQVGYNHQMNNWILGVEADIQWSGIKGELSGNFNADGDSLSFEAGTEVEWFGTIRARIGHALTERFMIYATGGAAYGKVESYISGNFDGESFSESVSDTNWGWTVGAGAEYAINDNWTFKTEYLYTDLGKSHVLGGEFPVGDISAIGFDLDNDVAFHTVRAGLNYRF